MNPRRLPRSHAPKAHLQPLYLDQARLLDEHVATQDELDLIRLGFAIILDAHNGQLCVPCGRRIMDRIGARPGIAEAAMRVITSAGAHLGMHTAVAIHQGYDFFDPEDRKSAFCDLADYWTLVVVKMRTCGLGCRTCNSLGMDWARGIGNHTP